MIDDKVKQELLDISSGEEWNKFVKKHPKIKGKDLDKECAEHINGLIRLNARKEALENPDTHYEAF